MNQRRSTDVALPGDPVIRVLSIVEGTWVTGPIKPLMMFARLAREGGDRRPTVDLSLVTTVRGKANEIPSNLLLSAAAEAAIHVDVIPERRPWDPAVLTRLCRLIEVCKPDIVETHQVKCHFMLAQALLWRRIRKNFAWIAYHHGYTRANFKLRLYETLDRWSLRKADRIATVCEPFADELVRNGAPADRLVVIPNTVESCPPPETTEVRKLREELHLTDQDFVILSIGRLSPEKGHIDLIFAFKKWIADSSYREMPTLLIVGDGPERQRLEQAAIDLGDRIRFLGHRPDVWPLYFIADIFVLPSHSEGSPLVLFEAMAAERAIVATAVGGVPETVDDGISAVLVPPHSVDALKDALASLNADSGHRVRLAGAAGRALKSFSPEAYRDRILALYRDVMSTP